MKILLRFLFFLLPTCLLGQQKEYIDKLMIGLMPVGSSEKSFGNTDEEVFNRTKFIGAPDYANASTIEDKSVATGKYRRVEVERIPRNSWEVQLELLNLKPIKKGEIIYLTFFARGDVSNVQLGGQSGVASQVDVWGPGEGYSGFLGRIFPLITTEWKQFHLSVTANADANAGEMKIMILCGYVQQWIEIAGLTPLVFPASVNIKSLPQLVLETNYKGRELGAKWRKEANQRIDKLRKAPLKIKVVDTNGNPVAGAKVHIEMKRHGFPFGTAVNPAPLNLSDLNPNFVKYREILSKYFNRVVFEGHHKPDRLMGQKRESSLIEIDSARRFILQKDLSVHGHVIVWPGWVHYPKDFRKRYEYNPDSLRAVLADYVTETVTHFRGQQVNWDVINEPYKNSDFAGMLGESVMIDWFKLAHQADPEAHLFINEPCVLKSTGDAEPWRKSYERMISLLLDGGAPVYGIGEQSHITLANYQAPEVAFQSLNRFAKFGLPIRISELDIEAPDPESAEQQLWMSDALRDALIVYFSHPQVEDITFWGFWQGMHWKPNAALWDKHWNLRPHGKAFLDLVYKEWWTDQTEVTSQPGGISIRGFIGDYEITAVNGKSKQTQKVKLTKDGLEILIKF